MKITCCPYCKEYLAIDDSYKFCMYCGELYDKNKLIEEDIGDCSTDVPQGPSYPPVTPRVDTGHVEIKSVQQLEFW